MSTLIPIDLLEAYSQGEITRREIEDRAGDVISCAALRATQTLDWVQQNSEQVRTRSQVKTRSTEMFFL